MEMITAVVLVGCVVALVGCANAFRANRKTHSQRLQILESLRKLGPTTGYPMLDLYDEVTYERHMWRVFWFRDPMQLYPPTLRDRITEFVA